MTFTSCSKLGELSADNFTVTPNPLETQKGVVPATINGHFPEKYMKKKAVVTVVPELRYSNGAVEKGTAATFQGESVRGNDQTINYKMGGNYTMKTSFAYVGDNKAEMFLTFDARIGKKKMDVPAVKVADGIVATSDSPVNSGCCGSRCISAHQQEEARCQHQVPHPAGHPAQERAQEQLCSGVCTYAQADQQRSRKAQPREH